MPEFYRTAYGFGDLKAYFDRPVGDIVGGDGVMAERIDTSMYQHNEEFYNALMSSFVARTTLAKERFVTTAGGRLQNIEPQHGVPRPTLQYRGYDIGSWIEGFGDAYGDNRVSREMQTVGDVSNTVRDIQDRDRNTAIDSIFAAMLVNRSFQWLDESRLGYVGAGIITVQPLANGDDTPYIKARGRTVDTDDHYLTCPSISTTADPFPRIKRALTEHGTDPDARVVVYVPDDLASNVTGMNQFIPRDRPDVNQGANAATVTNVPGRGIGDEVLGMVSGCWIIQCSALPEGYMLAHMEGRRPLSMREYPRPNLQGLRREQVVFDGNHLQTSFIRIAGYSGRDRTAAAVIQVGVAEGTEYTPPEGYSVPEAAVA